MIDDEIKTLVIPTTTQLPLLGFEKTPSVHLFIAPLIYDTNIYLNTPDVVGYVPIRSADPVKVQT